MRRRFDSLPLRPSTLISPPPPQGFCYDSKFHNRALQCSYLLDRSGMVRWW